MDHIDVHKMIYKQQLIDNPPVIKVTKGITISFVMDSDDSDYNEKRIIKCLTCKHCLPPSSRKDDKMCNKDSCSFEKA